MTKKQRIALWRRVSQCFDRHEREMIKVAKRERKIGPCQAHAYEIDDDEKRMDIIGQNGNDGEHYEELQRSNWWGLADDWDTEDEWEKDEKVYKVDGRHPEPDATGMEEDLPSAAEDCAKQRGSYEI
tara:strand:+ start:324 stop:704 length:381 start_codon:yes stop_codon:yes gene_type:complete